MKKQSLDWWAKRLAYEDMPIFAHTAKYIMSVSSRDDSSLAELARVILQDASMTTRVLRMANTVYYNPSRANINTVSRAVIMLGFNTVRSMCISYSLVESVLKGKYRDRVLKEMARSFHAAVQAQRFAAITNDRSPEEVFIAALLYRLGHIAFWCFPGNFGDRLETAMSKAGTSQEQAEQQVLGFRLQHLTRRLSKEWHLSKLLEDVLDTGGGPDTRGQHVLYGYKVAGLAEAGWDTPQMQSVIGSIAEFLKVPEEMAAKVIRSNARDAVQIAEDIGTPGPNLLIPMPPRSVEHAPKPVPVEPAFQEPDRLLQLKVLCELHSLLFEKELNVNSLFSLLLEGIFRGIGMDRVLFALLSSDRRYLKGKFGFGWEGRKLVQSFHLEARPQEPNLFSHILDTRRPVWVESDPPPELARFLTPEVKETIGTVPFFAMPVCVEREVIGIIYADRQSSGRELDEESFISFRYFGQQANLCLSWVRRSPS